MKITFLLLICSVFGSPAKFVQPNEATLADIGQDLRNLGYHSTQVMKNGALKVAFVIDDSLTAFGYIVIDGVAYVWDGAHYIIANSARMLRDGVTLVWDGIRYSVVRTRLLLRRIGYNGRRIIRNTVQGGKNIIHNTLSAADRGIQHLDRKITGCEPGQPCYF